ncbi:MAG: NTP transferase domain-containing protein [Bacteroidales bacterium]|nr:NTP transferase domain-containing protein [Bacteroidales bacterium]
MQPSLLILAAGMGSRYGGLKQISRFGPSGETIIEYSIFDAVRAGFDKVVIVLRKSFADEFMKTVISRALKKVNISFVYQELENLPEGYVAPPDRVKPWGTGHAILMAENEINTPFVVINADDFYGTDSYRVIFDFLSRPQTGNVVEEYCLVDYLLKNTLSRSGSVARGICQVDKNGYLTEIIEHKNIFESGNVYYSIMPDKSKVVLTGHEHVSMNMMGFLPSFFLHLKRFFTDFLQQHVNNPAAEFYLPEALNRVIHEGLARVRVLPTDARWFGVTYADDRTMVSDNLRDLVIKGMYPRNLWDQT